MTAYQLKPFTFNLADLQFILDQVNFVPLFDAFGNAIIAWDGTGAIYKTSAGASIPDNQYDTTGLDPAAAMLQYGTSYDTLTAAQGLRNVSGIDNNLLLVNHNWAAVDQPFLRDVNANFDNYVAPLESGDLNATYGAKTFSVSTAGNHDYSHSSVDPAANVVDYTPRMISKTITTGGATPLLDPVTHQVVHFDAALYAAQADASAYRTLIQISGIDINAQVDAEPIELTPAVVLLDGNSDPLLWNLALYTTDTVYQALVDNSGVNIATLTEGAPIELVPAVYLTDGLGDVVVWDSALYATDLDYMMLIDTVAPGGAGLIDGAAVVADWGILAGGQTDPQDPTNGEMFFGAINPGVAPGNSWLAYFGQFFDHGLDFVSKGAAGVKITIPLATDDPLYRAPDANIPGDQGNTKITVSRADVSGYDANGNPEYVNHTSPYIDQSQTYGSHAQMTSLLREWVTTDGGASYHAGAHLLDGATSVAWTNSWGETTNATLPTLNELRAHLVNTGRDDLTWQDVLDLRNRDENGDVIDTDLGTAGIQSTGSGQALLLDMNPHFDTAHFTQELIDALAVQLIFAGVDGKYALGGPGSLGTIINFATFEPMSSNASQALNDLAYEVLLQSVGDHYIAGDGRVNENIGLTTIHHVFHEEHNFQVRNLQDAIQAQDARAVALGDATHTVAHDWQVGIDNGAGGFFTDAAGNYTVSDGGAISWNEGKLFDAAKLTVEMEYQHAAVDQYARTITPDIPEFVGYNSGENSTVSLEYAQGAFRFGHSTMRETIDFMDPTGGITGKVMSIALEQAFLNPQLYSQTGAAAIALGMTHQQMNEIDELLTPAMNQGLLGQPLDLAAINIARGRDIGLPTLNDFREAVGLTRYNSWFDYGNNMVHPESLANFIAAYSLDGNVAKANAIVGLENGTIFDGTPEAMGLTVGEAVDFLNGGDLGFNKIDTWIGGLAEVHVMGGLLGETFNLVFVDQINRLMDGDRFYYLYRLNNLNMGDEIANAQFKDIVERNTGLEHLNGSVFAYADQYVDLSAAVDPLDTTGSFKTDHKYADQLTANPGMGIYSTGGVSTAGNGTTITIGGVQYIRDVRAEGGYNNLNVNGENLDGTPDTGANSNEVLIATDNNDLLYMQAGDDTAYGEGGNDIIYGGAGIDRLYGGDGHDTIYGGDSGDLIDGGAGDDILYGESSGTAAAGLDQIIGAAGNDIIYGGVGIDKISGGAGDDIIFGGGDTDAFTHGGDGNDYIDGQSDGDLLWGDGGDDLIVGGNNQDIVAGLDGDDILRPGNPSSAMGGGPDEVLGGDGRSDAGNDGQGIGFDLIDFSDYAAATSGVNADFITQTNPLVAIDGTTPFPAWVGIEGIIGSRNNDTVLADANDNWLIGGSGNDQLEGGIGDDLIIGDGIRLDSLIGTYSDTYTHDFDGASHRAFDGASTAGDRVIGTNGLLDVVSFDKHFTTMLQSDIFKDLELGGSTISTLNGVAGTSAGDGGTAGLSDKAVFTGDLADYTIERVIFTDAHGTTMGAFKVTDNGSLTRAASDGTDVVVGVETLEFADQTLNLAPVIAGGASAAFNAAENQLAVATFSAASAPPGDIMSYALSGADAAAFTINAAGELTFKSDHSPNFEVPADVGANNIYNVNVVVTDTATGLAALQAVAVTVTNEEEVATGQVHVIAGSAAVSGTTGSATASSTVTDPDLVSIGNPTGAVSAYQWQQLQGSVWNNILINPTATTATLSGVSDVTARVTQTSGSQTFISPETVKVGSASANSIVGTAGTDILIGLGGNDTYYVSNFSDVVIESTGQGTDTVYAAVDFALQAGSSVEYLRGNAGSTGLTLTGNELANTFTGGGGNDAFIGGDGNDVYFVANSGDAVIETSGQGTDTVYAAVNYTLQAGSSIEYLRGNAGSTGLTLTGNELANAFLGGTGNDTFVGGDGNDNYYVSNIGDMIVESVGQGTDTVYAAVDFALQAGSSVESLRGNAGSTGLTLTGNELANTFRGGSGNDIFNGLDGNDIFYVANVGDVVVESAGQGTDTVYAAVDYTLQAGSSVEYLRGNAGSTGLTLTGNELANTFLGGTGNDTFVGGDGNDVYYLTNVGDQVLESLGQGNDIVFASTDFALQAGSSVERIFANAGSTGLNLTGNELDNVIRGGAGADTLIGGLGSDTFVFNYVPGVNNIDSLSDFLTVDDQIQLENGIFTGLGLITGILSADAFAFGSSAGDATDRIIYDNATGALHYDADGLNGSAQVQIANIGAGLQSENLSHVDFQII